VSDVRRRFGGGNLRLGHGKTAGHHGVWFGDEALFLFLWLIGLINELQSSVEQLISSA